MKKIKLSEMGVIVNGSPIPSENGTYPAYGGNGIIKNVADFNQSENVIAIGRVGVQCGIVHYCETKCWITDNCLCFKPNKNFNSYYLYYLLKFLDLNKFHIGSAQPLITQSIINNIDCDFVLEKPEQDKIGYFLYLLDKKISLNKKINSTLEAMARTIYLHKFFRKAANGKIGDIIIENPKSTISVSDAKNSDGDFPFFTSGEAVLNWNVAQVDGRNIFLNDGGNVGVKFYEGKAAYSTHIWSIKTNGAEDYLYLLLDSIQTEIEKRFFTGTGLKNLRKDLLRDHKIYIPSSAELEEFNCLVQPCFSIISNNLRENYRLAKLRDWLLPLLMNGQVGLKEKFCR